MKNQAMNPSQQNSQAEASESNNNRREIDMMLAYPSLIKRTQHGMLASRFKELDDMQAREAMEQVRWYRKVDQSQLPKVRESPCE